MLFVLFSRTCAEGTNGKATVGEGGGTREGGQVVRSEEDEWNAGGRVIDTMIGSAYGSVRG